MKKLGVERETLDSCIAAAQQDRVVVTRKGQPVALVVGLDGMDAEQVELGGSAAFWKLISERRKQKTLTRAELERTIQTRKKPGSDSIQARTRSKRTRRA